MSEFCRELSRLSPGWLRVTLERCYRLSLCFLCLVKTSSKKKNSVLITKYVVSLCPAIVSSGGTIQLANSDSSVQGLQTLTMTNAGGIPAGAIVQSIQTQDGPQQIFVPAATGNLSKIFFFIFNNNYNSKNIY